MREITAVLDASAGNEAIADHDVHVVGMPMAEMEKALQGTWNVSANGVWWVLIFQKPNSVELFRMTSTSRCERMQKYNEYMRSRESDDLIELYGLAEGYDMGRLPQSER
mmetsp:Transcript_105772/g.341209  ORF Transcript_105772/g.341209 Transcript_105772/m.341209 type:complete len:109 (-) Transcript_105772:206-532(-)